MKTYFFNMVIFLWILWDDVVKITGIFHFSCLNKAIWLWVCVREKWEVASSNTACCAREFLFARRLFHMNCNLYGYKKTKELVGEIGFWGWYLAEEDDIICREWEITKLTNHSPRPHYLHHHQHYSNITIYFITLLLQE